MKIWEIVKELEQIYGCRSLYRLKTITDKNFRYTSDFDDVPPLNQAQYEKFLEKRFEKFQYSHWLEISEERFNRNLIELVLQKCTDNLAPGADDRKDFDPFTEPRLLSCKLKDGKICEIHLGSLADQEIPADAQKALLDSCRRNDLAAAKAAIKNGAYAATCCENCRSCITFAAEFGSVELCRLLIEDEAEANTHSLGWDAIFYAIKNPDVEVLKYLLEQGASTDVVMELGDEELPMTPLDYARYLPNPAAEKVLLELQAPTLADLKKWCYETADFHIRLSDQKMDEGDMSISATGDEFDEDSGFHVGRSTLCYWMELEDCYALIIPFFKEYFSREFEAYLEDNLVTLADAAKAIAAIRDFADTVENNFGDPQVAKLLSGESLYTFIEWGTRSSQVYSYLEELQLWEAHRHALAAFYRDFVTKLESIIADAKNCGDKFITFIGP